MAWRSLLPAAAAAAGILWLGFGLIRSEPVWIPAFLASAALLWRLDRPWDHRPAALSVAFFWKSLAGRCSRALSFSLCLLYGLGSWAFSVSSQGLWQHGPSQFAVSLGLWGLAETGFRWDAAAGLGFAMALAIRPD